MRFSVVVAAAAALLTPATAFSISRPGQAPMLADAPKVPGDSPLEFCPKAHEADIVIVENVDIDPNPPKACVCLGPSPENRDCGTLADLLLS